MPKRKSFALMAAVSVTALSASADTAVTQLSDNSFKVTFDNSPAMLVDFYGPNIFRISQNPSGAGFSDPEANPPAQILVDNPRKNPGTLSVASEGAGISISSSDIEVVFDKTSPTFSVKDLSSGKTVTRSLAPTDFTDESASITLAKVPGEYFYGGGVQNGRFSHVDKSIDIVNTNSWTDGGVASPTPFYWSTNGYGVMWYTFAPGKYDFGADGNPDVRLTHDTPYLDIFIMVDDSPVGLLNDFYQLTGNPVLIPKFGFYEGHLNAYNRDFWKEDENGIPFEDGKKYKESQKDNGGIRESLNGELGDNYQFSARAVIDRYNAHDMPLGWILPNDGYGAGYGQASTFDGNIQNLKEFGDYARSKGVEIGLWTQSDLHPKDSIEPLLQRDIIKEVRDAGVRVLKTDVAWVGYGYSFGLNGVADVGQIMPEYGEDARPFIISLDGWAGTQRYAGVWSGDQTGGEWEYIRFHIPTYIGSGLSGQPNITSDMDGIFGGKNLAVNVRDFQWKTFTPMQLNMDGWGANPKYPHAVDGAEDINRAYLKLKSQLIPYAYTIAREAVDGMPMMRAMFLDYPNDFTHATATKYQFMYGPYFLVAPIYQETLADENHNDLRHNIYLPDGIWFDYLSGTPYTGGMVWNYFESPLWKLPVFVKADAIIPMTNPNNNPSQIDKSLRIYELWPVGKGEFTEYDDDGTTQAYLSGQSTSTIIKSEVKDGNLFVEVQPTSGSFNGFEPMKSTEFIINISKLPRKVTAKSGKKNVKLTACKTLGEFNASDNAWYFNPAPNRLKPWGVTDATDMNPQLMVKVGKTDITKASLTIEVKGFELNTSKATDSSTPTANPAIPEFAIDSENDILPYSILLKWPSIPGAEYIEIEHDGLLYSNLDNSGVANCLLFEDMTPATEYTFKIRSKSGDNVSEWREESFTTKDNPLEFAIKGITASSSAPDQPGFNIFRLFDFEEKGDIWHTLYSNRDAAPFDMVIDLNSFNTLDRFDYLPRTNAGNGTILKGSVAVSENGTDWTEAGTFEWDRTKDTKSFIFEKRPSARFIRIHVDETVGGFGSGREIYVFKVPGTPTYIPGDINNDGKIDENDLTSYTNYTGLRKGDSDFDYVSIGDINRNGLIDAYDISYVATRLDNGIKSEDSPEAEGSITLLPDKKMYSPGDDVSIKVKGDGLKGVNALSFSLPYNTNEFEYVSVEPLAIKGMENLSYDRLHTSGDKVLHPTFVNIGERPLVEGDDVLFIIHFKAKQRGSFSPQASDIVIAGRNL